MDATLTQTFRANAERVSAIVAEVADPGAAAAYAVNLCAATPGRILAAPGLPEDVAALLAQACEAAGVALLESGMRAHLQGVDVGLTWAGRGIAETGTLVVDSRDEEVRLATMLSERHVCILPRAGIAATAMDLREELDRMLADAPAYTAFITGASRTSDIERVLTLGVHGPLELHILVLGG